jgi:hypothetical protein
MEEDGLGTTTMAERMKTSRQQPERLPDPQSESVIQQALQWVVQAEGEAVEG